MTCPAFFAGLVRWLVVISVASLRSQNERSDVSVQANLRSRLNVVAGTKDDANTVIVFNVNWNKVRINGSPSAYFLRVQGRAEESL